MSSDFVNGKMECNIVESDLEEDFLDGWSLHMNKKTTQLLNNIERQINKVVFSSMIIGRFPTSWSFEAYNKYLCERGLSLYCRIVRFVNSRLAETQRSAINERITERYPNICIKTYGTYIVCLFYEQRGQNPPSHKEFSDLVSFLVNDSDVMCFTSEEVSDVSDLTETYLDLKKTADTEQAFKGKFRDQEVMGIYSLEYELFDKIESGCIEEIPSILTSIVEAVNDANSLFLTDKDDVLICVRNYFGFLWREITRVIYERTGKRSTLREYITIDLEINMASDSNELEVLMIKFIEQLVETLKLTSNSICHRIIDDVKQIIFNNCHDDISLTKVAEQVGLSSTYLSKLFKKVEGKNFIDYVIATKMERARELAEKGDLNVNEIAEAVGYSNANYFSTAFHRYFGMTAKECITRGRDVG